MFLSRLSLALGLTIAAALTVSLFVKDSYLWMDEVLSYLLLTDPSLAHMNRAVVSNMDANPPLFTNLYWQVGHWISQNPYVLKSVSISLFAITVGWFLRYVTNVLATAFPDVPRPQLTLVTFLATGALVSLTYLNYTLSTQLRSYSLYLLISWAYIVVLHRNLLVSPTDPSRHRWLLAHALVGVALAFTHNVALFYLAASGACFGLLWLVNRRTQYLLVLGSHVLIALIWLIVWYPSFTIQSQAGQPHSWIPLPTFWSFFQTIGDLLPTLSSGMEHRYPLLALLRVGLVLGFFGYVVVWQLRRDSRAVWTDSGFSLYILSGFMTGTVLVIALMVSLVHVSVFLNRYFWPSSLLLLYQLLYGGWWLYQRVKEQTRRAQPVPGRFFSGLSPVAQLVLPGVFLLGLGGFMIYQNRKVPLFSGEIRHDIARLTPGEPVFVESAYYFLPLSQRTPAHPIQYLFDWPSALDSRNELSATTDYKILESANKYYNLAGLVQPGHFNAAHYQRFYVVDEASRYLIEPHIASGQVKVERVIPAHVPGHRILECHF